ncbi:proteasome activator complex subunit 4 isoform X2 [Orussus abietinus]|nr:proteasome activator complex subunit 4 isoform X2 [Orussus abietinus]
MKFSKEDHILFIKLMYELLTIPNLEPFLVNKFGSSLILLLKKKELISPEELELPWRPLYNLMHSIICKRHAPQSLHRYFSSMDVTLDAVVQAVKIYFPLSATREILDEIRPMLCPLNGNIVHIEMLVSFLPLQLAPKHHSLGYELWFNEFMVLWEVCHNAPQWENEIMWLMAKLATHNIGYIDWEPHLPLMFTRFVRCLNFPVSYKNTQSRKHHKIETSPIAMWIVAVLGNGSSSQMYLEKFMKTVETYFHPANFGSWLNRLKELLKKLPYHFISRLHKERYGKPTWETPVPDTHKLTDDDVDAFVKCVTPVAMTAMFSKTGVNDACHALQYLATMRPSLVIPDVLERMYSTLDSLTEPHKLTAVMICMVAVARPMVQGSRNVNKGYTYPEGPSHVLPLLFSSLPGIDPNDARKCFVTFRLISVYATLVPIMDSSKSQAPMDEEERLVCESTSRFEDFILQFLDRIFAFIESSSLEFVRLESLAGDGKSKLESMAESALAGVCTSLLIQTNDALFECALHKLRSFVTERILETKVAGQLAAVLCKIFTRVNGHNTLRALLPVLSETILECVGEGDEIIKEENLDNKLLYAMLLLSEIVDTLGNHLLPYLGTLKCVLDKVLHLKSREGSRLAHRLLKEVLHSLSNVAPNTYHTLTKNYNDPEYPSIRNWGQGIEVNSLNIEWYVPGDEEITAVQEIFSRYLPPEVARIEEYSIDKKSLTREELLTSLNIVNSIVEGCESLLPIWSEPPVVMETVLDQKPFLPTLGIKGEIKMPDGSNVRCYLAKVMCTLQDMMLENSEDDVKSLFVLIRIWSGLLLGKMRLRNLHEARRKNFQFAKKILEDKLLGKKRHLGPFIIERATLQHESRIFSQAPCLTETHLLMMEKLFKLSISRYADVRSKAQKAFFSAIQNFPYSYSYFIEHIVDVLRKSPEKEHEAYKGALYLLLGPQQDPLVTKRDWSLLRVLWPAIVRSQPSEKPSVIRLKESLTNLVHQNFPTTTINLEIPDDCVKVAEGLWDFTPQPITLPPNEAEIKAGTKNLKKISEHNLRIYNELVNDLLHAVIEENLHWRHKLMAMGFIRDLVHPDQEYSPRVVHYFLDALIHDSLDVRKIAIKTVIYMLKQQKRKHPKVTANLAELQKSRPPQDEQSVSSERWSPGERSDNTWLLYDYENRPLTVEQWDESRYVHKPYIGYYAWPKKLEIYAPSDQQPSLDLASRTMTPSEREVHDFFDDPQNVDKLVKFLVLEEHKGKDKFNVYHYLLFKGLFRNHGDAHLKHFLPHLQRLVADKHESHQRCAAEITAGLIKGAKHWPFQMTENMWKVLLPVVRVALGNLTVETVEDWGICFATAQERRDPNKHHWLLECLMEEPPLGESEASFVECGRLYALQSALTQHFWRVPQLLQRLLARLEDRLLANPFQIVRDRLGSLLTMIFYADLRFPYTEYKQSTPKVQDLIDKVVPRLQRLAEDPTMLHDNASSSEKSIMSRVANVTLGETKMSTNNNKVAEREAAIRLFKTVCKWLIGSISRSQYGALSGFYELFPIICQLENCDVDEELTKTCSMTLALLAQALTLPCHMTAALNAVTKVSKSSSWWARATCLEFLQVLVFHNMSIILSNQEWVSCVRDIVLRLLEDDRLEVREKAGQVLGGLLHCTFITDHESLLEQFKIKAKTRIRKRRHGSVSYDEDDKIAEAKAIRVRHAGVLGLCSFIRAHPYDVPKYVPPVLEHLGLHLNDPLPIPATIRKTLGDFKRTHYDGWNGLTGHIQQFTEEQLVVLQDLTVPPSYYA